MPCINNNISINARTHFNLETAPVVGGGLWVVGDGWWVVSGEWWVVVVGGRVGGVSM